MKDIKQKYILEYTGISYLILDDLWYWLEPDDGGILLKNVSLGLWILLLVASISSLIVFRKKLYMSKNKKQFCIDNDIILEIAIVITILSVSNIFLKIKNIENSILIVSIIIKIVGLLFIIFGIIIFYIYLKKVFLKSKHSHFSFFLILGHLENLIVCSIMPIIFGFLILR